MRLKYSISLLLAFTSLLVYSQHSRTITGTVYDANDNTPLIGASVIVKGTAKGAVTNINGQFKYMLSGADISMMVLEASYLGYEKQSVLVKGDTAFVFYLEPDRNSLEEVVVTSSYGTKKLKQEVVGAITSVQTKDMIIEQSATSFDEMLEGQAAGVYIETTSEVGGQVDIHIRGQGTLTSLNNNNTGTSTQPLIIVDGVIMAEEIVLDGSGHFDGADGTYSEDLMNPLAKIGITDIESINVLKDAAAVSLYGADGANGVIVITTKGGQAGKMKFNFSAQGGFNTSMNHVKYMDGEQYQEIRNLYYANSGENDKVSDWNGVNTDWYDLLNRNGSSQRYNLSASGGSEILTYRVGVGYSNIQESQVNNEYVKYSGNVSLGVNLKKFKASIKFSPSISEKNSPNTLYAFAVPPTLAVYDTAGNYTKFDFYGNPLAVANQNKALVETKSLVTSYNLSYQLLPNLKLSTLFGLDFSDKNQDNFFSALNQTGVNSKGEKGRRVIRGRNTNKWNWNAQLFYDKNFNDIHYVDVLAGVETRANTVDYSYAMGYGFPQDGVVMLPVSEAENRTYDEDKSESKGRSFFSQLNYDFKKKYFLLANFRIDQSSTFGDDNNTSYNGGVGLSWNITEEAFLSNVSWLKFLRMRVSYGTSGNSRIGSYRALGLYSVYADEADEGYNLGKYAYHSTMPNHNLGWEKNYKFNTGIDINISTFLSGSFEFFNDDIQDMIVSRSVVPESGYSSVQINGANMYNRGFEASIRATVVSTQAFKWTSSINYTRIRNEVTYLKGLGSQYSSDETARAQRIGYSTSVIWGHQFVGIDPASGKELYNVDGSTVTARYLREHFVENEYWQPIGNSSPDYYGGFNNQFKIGKTIDVGVNFSYSIGADKLIDKTLVDQYRTLSTRNMSLNAYYQSWREPGDIAYYPMLGDANPLISNSTKYLYDASNIKLKSVRVAYKFPLKKYNLPLDGLRVYFNASNLFHWYLQKSPDGLNGIKELYSTYPDRRNYSVGINASF